MEKVCPVPQGINIGCIKHIFTLIFTKKTAIL